MKQQLFKPGAIVQCRTGGSAMTVLEYTDKGVMCVWMARTGKGSIVQRRTGVFPEYALCTYRYTPKRRASKAL